MVQHQPHHPISPDGFGDAAREPGRLVESGSHDMLVAADGTNAKLVRLQRRHLRLATSIG